MKKIILTCFTGSLLVGIITNVSNAQILTAKVKPSFESTVLSDPLVMGSGREIIDLRDINQKALKHFSRSIKNAKGEKWFEKRDGYVVYYMKDGYQSHAVYNIKGNWLYTIGVYSEENLPFSVRDLVKRNYYDFNIFQVLEIKIENKIIYLVRVEDKTSWKTIRVQDGEMQVIEQYRKSG